MKILTQAAVFAFIFFYPQVFACTAFQLRVQDGSNLYCRSLEYGLRLDSNLLVVPRQTHFNGTVPNNGQGAQWTSIYGYVGMNQNFAQNMVSDGMNEKGLIVGALYMPGFTKYQEFNPEIRNSSLGSWELTSFLLGRCSTIEEAREVLSSLNVVEENVPGMPNFTLPLHYYITDSSGDAIVVEYVGGSRKEYRNPVRVLTNSPPFPWHMNNLANYVNLSPYNAGSLELADWTVENYGQGSGSLGLPGDYTPPSRFIRATLFSDWALVPAVSQEGVRLGFNILNNFNIFEGVIRKKSDQKKHFKNSENGQRAEITQWTIVHDPSDLKTYFRSYESLQIQMVDLRRINFNQQDLRTVELFKKFSVEDMTDEQQLLIETSFEET